MNHRNAVFLLVFISLLVPAISVTAAECDDPNTNEAISQCLGKELRDADSTINSLYKKLMDKLNESDKKTTLRSSQRAWIKDRDSICKLDTKESNRERWYQELLQDYPKTVCITRYTRQRIAELASMLTKPSSQPNDTNARATAPATTKPPATAPASDVTQGKKSAVVHANGKWYFELTVDYAEAVKIEPCVLTIGVSDNQHQFNGVLDNIRMRDGNKDILRYGFAVDLDNGKLYFSRNGAWVRGEPGSNLGLDLKLGRNYFAAFLMSADDIAPYLERKAVVPNFGDTSMTYALPAGYTPWQNRTQN
jgi:uncharacterized protein YecT (DUF1311 family)